MEAYTGFAEVYDLFMEDVPYEAWRDFLSGVLRREGIADGLVCELGCGTGRMTRLLAGCGYDMIGIDLSQEMLSIAREKESEGILYLEQDMREFELYGTVRAVVSVCDSMNYVLEEEDMLKVFCLVNNYLDPGGIFLFDLNTEYKFRELMGTQVFCEHHERGTLVWENYYDEETKVNEYALTIFSRQEQGLYRKYEELHYERSYGLERVICLLEQAGLEFVCACDGEDHGAVRKDSERIYILAKECQKGAGSLVK
ncbi:MAG: class I SAM-dependent methyltransferase [Eubacterium sp.]|nr:class I SAM-dependent methyltransferase [Eubacterium sp.]